ncbi:hypothetical protein GQX73_g1010 [Xylaria multiplex]|uniref:NACHT domain-containing protein n=1 Tax=Xylaria multiplex TaxID=323545 RepID=A0A7C8MSJ9_9PEZI|nr:hypothetical protein GQX73_g1010 [Xylaria multiplex]
MDPISALGIASSVITFIDFAAKLISTTKVIFHSKEGASTDDLALTKIYTKLQDLSACLASSAYPQQPFSSPQSLEDVSGLQELSAVCEQDCQEIVNALQAIKIHDNDGRLWGSMKTAFKSKLGRSKITAIESRLERTQRVMSLHISSILSNQISQLSKKIESMSSSGRGVGPASIIESMSQDLANLKLESESINIAKQQSIFSAGQAKLFVDLLKDLANAEKRFEADGIISSLNYTCRPVRHDIIPQAHMNTFQWAFEKSSLSDWLCSSNGIFWVSGKAGSGKSTFMKFLAGHFQTRELLTRWAGGKFLVTAAHYFWSTGTDMQKSQQGLLRSLLFDIFRSYPDCIPIVCPSRWATAKIGNFSSSWAPWTTDELSKTLRALTTIEDEQISFCFYIDGLDEYEGDHIELCSRPWPVFEASFGSETLKKLYVHDLTRGDIKRFAKHQLRTHPRWAVNPAEISENEKCGLIEQVAERAEGVFLWAFLVTRSLREGLSNDDTVVDMWRRLQSLPSDLERLFKHMLDSVDDIYRPKMAGALQVAIHAFEPLPVEIYWHLEKEFEEQNYAICCAVRAPETAERERQREQIRRRINAQTKGLLETRKDRVEFLHRTVRDFLRTAEMSDYLNGKLSTNFNAFNSIAKSYLALLKTASYTHGYLPQITRQGPGRNWGVFIASLNQALLYAAEAFKTTAPTLRDTAEILDGYEIFVAEIVESSHLAIDSALECCDPRLLFREEVVKHQLAPYIQIKVQEEPEYFSVFQDSPLFAALTPMTTSTDYFFVFEDSPLSAALKPMTASGANSILSPNTLKILLEHFDDLNVISPRASDPHLRSPWVSFMYECSNSNQLFNSALKQGIFNLLLFHGADPDACIGNYTAFCTFLAALFENPVESFETACSALDAFLRARPSLGIVPGENIDLRTKGPAGGSVNDGPQNERAIKSTLDKIISGIQWKEKLFDVKEHEVHYKFLEKFIIYALGELEDPTPLASAMRNSSVPPRACSRLLRLIGSESHDHVASKKRRYASNGETDEESIGECQSEDLEITGQPPKRQKAADWYYRYLMDRYFHRREC